MNKWDIVLFPISQEINSNYYCKRYKYKQIIQVNQKQSPAIDVRAINKLTYIIAYGCGHERHHHCKLGRAAQQVDSS